MSRPKVSVVMSTYQRAHLLARSLICYQNQDFDNSQFELVVIDDHSTDKTRELVLDWSASTRIKATVLTPSPKDQKWRDCAMTLNFGIRASSGEHVILTHPEVMPGRQSVKHCVETLEEFETQRKKGPVNWEVISHHPELGPLPTANPILPLGCYACCKVYYLSQRDQSRIDWTQCQWREQGALAVRQIPEFYLEEPGHPDYSHATTDAVGTEGFRIQEWESWVFGGCSRETWKRLGGMLETTKWGSVDVGFMQRRKTLGIPTVTGRHSETICVHQCHDSPNDVPTPRDMNVWVQELRDIDLRDPTKLVYPAIDNL